MDPFADVAAADDEDGPCERRQGVTLVLYWTGRVVLPGWHIGVNNAAAADGTGEYVAEDESFPLDGEVGVPVPFPLPPPALPLLLPYAAERKGEVSLTRLRVSNSERRICSAPLISSLDKFLACSFSNPSLLDKQNPIAIEFIQTNNNKCI